MFPIRIPHGGIIKMKKVRTKRSDLCFLRQHRTEIAAQIRSQIFRQIVQKFCRHTDVCQKIYVQDAGKYASICAAKPSGGLCAVLPIGLFNFEW